jgi:hypothetical protein
MRIAMPIVLITASLALAGCQDHEAKVVDLQQEHDRLAAQYKKDCPAPRLDEVPVTPSQKCQDEDQKLGALEKEIKAEQLKQ